MEAETKIKKWGNSLGIVVPVELVRKLELKGGSVVKIEVKKKKKLDGFGLAKGKSKFTEEKESHEKFW